MTAVSSETGPVAARYAAAFLDMADDARAADDAARDLADLGRMLDASPELALLVKTPVFGRARQRNALLAVAERAGFHPLTRQFLGTLAANGRLGSLPGILKAFEAERLRRQGRVSAVVETAFPLNDRQMHALKDQLARATGADVALDVRVNGDLLGGLVVTLGSKQIDASVRSKLERLKRVMSAGRAA